MPITLPTPGQSNWGTPLNTALTALDTRLVTAEDTLTVIGPQGSWTDFVPVFKDELNVTASLGNAGYTARYKKIGKTIFFIVEVQVGSTSNFNTGRIGLVPPFPVRNAGHILGVSGYYDASAAIWYYGFPNTGPLPGNIYTYYIGTSLNPPYTQLISQITTNASTLPIEGAPSNGDILWYNIVGELL